MAPEPVPSVTRDRVLLGSALAVLMLLLVLSLYFQWERLHLDSAHYLAHALNSGLPHVEHQRLVLALAQLPALLVWHLGRPMAEVLTAWSLTHVLWAWLAVGLCARLQRPELALAVALLQFVGRTEMFFSPVLEAGYGATCAIVLFALWSAHPVPRGRWLMAWAVLAVLLVTSHPVHVVTFTVVAAMVWRSSGRRSAVLLTAAGPLLLFVLLKGFAADSYESERLFSGWWGVRPPWSRPELWPGLAKLFLHHYPDLLFLLAASMGAWMLNGRRGRLLEPAAGLLLSLLLVNTLLRADKPGWYHEVHYMGLVTCGLLLFAVCLRGAGRRTTLALCAVALSGVLWRWADIAQEGYARVSRRAVIEELAERCADQGGKCVVRSDHHAAPFDRWEWSLPMEALLLGLAAHGTPVSLISTDDLDHDPAYAELPDSVILFRRFEPLAIDAVHPRFRMKAGPYELLE